MATPIATGVACPNSDAATQIQDPTLSGSSANPAGDAGPALPPLLRELRRRVCRDVRLAAFSDDAGVDISDYPDDVKRWARVLAAEFNLHTLDGCLTEAATEEVK